MTDRIHIVIATAGERPDLLQRTLQSVERCAKPASYQGLVVVENGPPQGIEEVVKASAPQLAARYLHVSERNKSRALNAALEAIGNGLAVFLDDDVRVHEQWLQQYADAASQVERGRFFGGPLGVDYAEAEPLPWVRPYLPPSAQGWKWEGENPIARPSFLGANWAAFVADVQAIGGFDVERGPLSAQPTGEESDAQARLLTAGVPGYYLPDAWVWHYVPADRCSIEWTIKRAYRNGLGNGLKHPPTDPVIGGWPLGIWRIRARGWARNIAAGLSCSRSWRFKARWWRSHTRGVMDGYRQAVQAGARREA